MVSFDEGTVTSFEVIYFEQGHYPKVKASPLPTLAQSVRMHSMQGGSSKPRFGDAVDIDGKVYGIVDLTNGISYDVASAPEIGAESPVERVAYLRGSAPVWQHAEERPLTQDSAYQILAAAEKASPYAASLEVHASVEDEQSAEPELCSQIEEVNIRNDCIKALSGPAPFSHEPVQVRSLDKHKLSQMRTYCLIFDLDPADSEYPAHESIVRDEVRRQASGVSLFSKVSGLKYVPRCSAADAYIIAGVSREQTVPDEDHPTSFRYDSWVDVFIGDEHQAAKIDAMKKRGLPVGEHDTVVAQVQGYGSADSTLEKSLAGFDVAEKSLRDAVGMALYGAMGLTENGKRVLER